VFNYGTNYIYTAKYKWWNFIIKNIFEQFMRLANLYFLLISILQVATPYSPTGKYGTVKIYFKNKIVPLVIVMLVTLVKDGIEDTVKTNPLIKR
jgi:hypothetical protein